jgi:AcrR family transcriptional regulator
VARWDPGAEDRLRRAALDLYTERGFEAVTVGEIAERAGLTRRTFFRYFADKREVLFAGAERLPDLVTEVVLEADAALTPFEVLLHALGVVGARVAEASPHARERRAVIAASPELQERERTKTASLATAAADGLCRRGVAAPTASLLAGVGLAILQAAFERWADRGQVDFDACFREATDEVTAGCRTRSTAS